MANTFAGKRMFANSLF